MNNYVSLVSKVWNYAHVLRDEGIPYGDYVEQITYLLFLKMDEERAKNIGELSPISPAHRWDKLRDKDGSSLERQYRETLAELSTQPGLLGTIFRRAQNKIQDPAKLKRLVSLIDSETWISLGVDVKGAIYEGLLERHAGEVKSGAGQYFTPRPLIDAMVRVMQPKPPMKICDPACGTGGFLLAAYEYMKDQTHDKGVRRKLARETFTGIDIVPEVVRLCAMNLYLHGIGGGEESPISQGDALATDPGKRYHMVLTNPPFGKKSSYTVIGEEGEIVRERDSYERTDFRVTTSNKQLNFLQHVMTILEQNGAAAVVLPDNVLFEGGAGERIRKRLLDQFELHTILRLPTGIFYKPGVKANVLFFDRKPASDTPWTKDVWIYDFRTNLHFTLVNNPLKREHLDDFVKYYCPGARAKRKESERFKRFGYAELVARDKLNLDIFWLKDESLGNHDDLPAPDVIAAEIVENLEAALEAFKDVAAGLPGAKAG
jgi:type I restriction enzyme M protein